jgi:4-hydroxy-tetrahydrodipicolinate reductase
MFATLPGSIANRPLNAIRPVCAAPPGILSTLDLPHIVADLA